MDDVNGWKSPRLVVLRPHADDLAEASFDPPTMPHPFGAGFTRRRLGADGAAACGPVQMAPIRSRPEVMPVVLRG
jgi:hypothetical protein